MSEPIVTLMLRLVAAAIVGIPILAYFELRRPENLLDVIACLLVIPVLAVGLAAGPLDEWRRSKR